MQPVGPFHAQLHELGVVDLPSHGKREPAGMRAQQVERLEHGLVVEVGVAHVRCAHDGRDTHALGRLEHRKRRLEVGGAVVHTGQDMAVQVAH